MNGIARRACPLCGGQISLQHIYTFTLDRTVSKRTGRVSRRFSRADASYADYDSRSAACFECGAFWDDDDFDIDDDWRFIDYKYKTKEEEENGAKGK